MIYRCISHDNQFDSHYVSICPRIAVLSQLLRHFKIKYNIDMMVEHPKVNTWFLRAKHHNKWNLIFDVFLVGAGYTR